MRLTTALNEYKRQRHERYPEECRTTEGAFSGHHDRLVHVSPTGALRDYSSQLSGLSGIDRSRFGIETDERTYWFEDLDPIRQHYYRDTRLVETEYNADGFTVHQYDLTLGRAHVTHFELRGAVPAGAKLVAFVTMAPEGKESRVGALIHEDAGPEGEQVLEVYHQREHDYLTASTGLDAVRGQRREQFEEILDDEPVHFPRGGVETYDETRLSGDFVVTAPFERDGRSTRTTLVSQLSDHQDVDRETALADLRRCATGHRTADAIRSAARDRTTVDVSEDLPRSETVRSDLRVLDLLEAPSGAHVAGPEFDPFFANTGGYGYVWFRDDANVSRHLLRAAERLDLDRDFSDVARFYCDTQLSDGTWPHRVWATDGSLAPGWANANVERKPESNEYQADQTASVTAFLAALLRERRNELEEDLVAEVWQTMADAVFAMDRSIDDNGLPRTCQNVWEDAVGQFTHTAAAYVRAYAAVARAPVRQPLRERAIESAERVLDGLEALWLPDQRRYGSRLTPEGVDPGLDASTLVLVDALAAYEEVEETSVFDQQLQRLATHVETTIEGLYRNPSGSAVAGLARYENDAWRLDGQTQPKVWSVTTAMGAIAAARTATLLDGYDANGAGGDGSDAAAGSDGSSAAGSNADADAAGSDAAHSTAADSDADDSDADADADANDSDTAESTADSSDADTTSEDAIAFDHDPEAFLDRAVELYELLDGDGPFANEAGYLAEQVFDDGSLDSATPLGWTHAQRLHATALLDDLAALPARSTAPTGPPERPRWTTGEKYGLSTAADHGEADPARVWFTMTEGALTEARFPRVDLMNLRTMDFLVRARDDSGYTVRTHRESRQADDTVERRVDPASDEALLFRHVFSEEGDGRGHDWTLTVEYAPDPEHDAIVADVHFRADDDAEYDVFAIANTALTNTQNQDRGLRFGSDGEYHLVAREPSAYTGAADDSLLVDEDGEGYSVAIAMAAADRFDWATVDVAGSDRLRGLFADGRLPDPQESVDADNIVLVGRIGSGEQTAGTVALGFARQADTAAALGEADGALDRGYETARSEYVDTWVDFLADKEVPSAVSADPDLANQYRFALMCLLAVEDKTYHGASIASPSVPWGEAVTADEPKGYGYNFVWSRDLYQVFTAFEIVDEIDVAVNQLAYIYEFQQDDAGFIPQNTYINGTTRWGGEQMDNISFPQVMAYQLAERGVAFEDAPYDYENVRRSANYVAQNGPATAQERWEEESGFSPSSIAAEIAGLACAAKLAIDEGETADALVWLALADHWTNTVENWTATTTGTDTHDHTPYYVRVARDGDPDAGHLRTLANDGPTLDEREIVDGGFLELVRLGIKPATDRTVRNSVREVDETIRVDVGDAAGFYRYNGDGYGERALGDTGAPWSVENKGKGRLWPLLTGERGEYELAADREPDPDPLPDAGDLESDLSPMACLRAMQSFANSGRMIAEQVWDREHGTDYDWEFGEGTGSATPLAWSMAQYVRLAHGISEGEPVETPAFVRERYLESGVHEPDESPALRVDTRFRGDELVVSGESTGALLAVKTPVETTLVEPSGGEFEVTVGIEHGQNEVVVAAASSEDLETAGTTVRRLTL